MILCNSTKQTGKFLFWRWEQWEIGGGGGVAWFFFNKEINPRRYNPLWWLFSLQYIKPNILREALLKIRKISREKNMPDHEADEIYNIACDALNGIRTI